MSISKFSKRMKAMLFAAAPGALLISVPVYAQDAAPAPVPAAPQGAGGGQDTAPAASQPADASRDDDIIVTALRTGAESLQKTPLAIAALSAQQLQDRQVTNIKDLVQYAPGLQVATSAADSLIFIRGVGTTNTRAGSDPDVTTQIDGVYIARPNAQLGDFFGVERIEILRGPQGTLYGRNAAGGTINVISRKPTDNFEGELALTGGNYGLFQAQGLVSGPIVPGTLQFSIAGNYIRHNGYDKNVFPGGRSVDSADRGSVRAQLRFEAGPIEAITRGDYSRSGEVPEQNDHLLAKTTSPAPLANSTVGNLRLVALNSRQFLSTRSGGVSEDITIALSPSLKFKSLTAYRESHYKIQLDADNTELTSFVLNQTENQKQFSQEFDINYNQGPIAAVAGFFYMREQIQASSIGHFYSFNRESGSLPFVIDHSKAVFAQGTLTIVPGLRATVGARYTWEDKSMNLTAYNTTISTGLPQGSPFVVSVKDKFNAFTPKFGLDYQFTPNAMIYASVTRGFKSGGFNYAAKAANQVSFDPETIWSYEAGLKSDWLDHRLRLNLTGFIYDYKNLQVQSVLAPGVVNISNAANAKIKGLEVELVMKPTDGLTFTSNVAFLDAKYDSFPCAPIPNGLVGTVTATNIAACTPAGTNTINAKGFILNYAPRFSTLQALQYDIPTSFGTITARAEYSWQSRSYFDATNSILLSQKGYGLANLALGWRSNDKNWQAQALVRNVGDTQYINSGSAQGFPPGGRAGAPRTVSFTLSRKF